MCQLCRGVQAEEEYEAALAARRAEMEAELLRKDLEQLQLLSEQSRPESAASLPSLSEDQMPSTEGEPFGVLQTRQPYAALLLQLATGPC